MNKITILALPLIITALITSMPVTFAAGDSQSELMKQTKITKDEATKIALTKCHRQSCQQAR